MLLREADERIGFIRRLAGRIEDARNPLWITHPMSELLRSRLYAMALGERGRDDLDDLRDNPALRLAVSERQGEARLRERESGRRIPDGLASQPSQSRLVETLSTRANLDALQDSLFDLAVRGHRAPRCSERARHATIDVDSAAIDVQSELPGSGYIGHYQTTCYHPLLAMLASTGDWLDVDA